MPRLIELIHAVADPLDYLPDCASLSITAITADSRQVVAGTLFVALKGDKSDGTQFVAQAQQAGAVAVLCDAQALLDISIPIIRARNPRLALAQMAAAFYARQPAHIVAVTGTDGKTSTADFFRQFWHGMGKSSASVGTLGILGGTGETLYPGTHTTPDPVRLHKMLAELAEKKVEYVCMEASSHGLDQYRLDGVTLQAAAFTNIARDHLDYHHTEEAYFAAKARLFAMLPAGATAVLNQDDARFAALQQACAARGVTVIGFGHKGEQFRITRLTPSPQGQRAELELYGKPYMVEIPLVGAFQAMNILAALGLVVATGGDLERALAVIAQFKGVPGRLEQVATLKNGASVFIDYAHTPMALGNILQTLRPHTQGKLHVVFGCGGDRDSGKRPEMGKIASELANVVIVTDDNPRSEDSAMIRRAIMAASPRAKEVADRAQAIYVAIQGLSAGDVLVIAGKGHETTQTIGDNIIPFDDGNIAREAVKAL